MASNTLKVSILGDWKDLRKTFDESSTGADKWAGRMSSAGTAMTVGVTGPIVAGAALAISAASDEQAQMEKLADTLEKRIPGATDEMIASNEEWVSNLQRSIAVSDGDIRAMEQSFIAAGASVEEAQRLTVLAYDTAAQTGKEATTVGAAFVKGIGGSVGALGKLGVATKDAAGESLTFDQITSDLSEKMGGSAAAAADTAAGRTENLTLQMADLTEQLGMILLPILDKLVGILTTVVEWFQGLGKEGQTVVLVIAGIAAAVGPVLIMASKAVKAFQAVTGAMKVLNLTAALNPWVIWITATVLLVALIIKNWDKISAFLMKVWDGIKKGVKALADWIVKTWEGIVSFFRGLPQKISSAVSGMWDGIKAAFRSAVNWIIRKWNNLQISIGGGSILGVSIPKITIKTPNIPEFHQGGTFSAPPGRREGLALLRDGERVSTPGAGVGMVVNVTINAGLGSDPNAISQAIVESLQRYSRHNGAIRGVRLAS